jgi:transposase
MPEIVFCGIDVSKASLSVAVLLPSDQLEEFSCANDKQGHMLIISRLSKLRRPALVVLEATSTYSLDLALALHRAKGISPALVNPRAAKDFARASMQRAKTDPLDARGLALFAQRMQPDAWLPPTAAALELRSLSRQLSSIVQLRTAECSRLRAAQAASSSQNAAASSERLIGAYAEELARLEKQALMLIHSEQQLEEDYQLLISFKGIAKRSAIKLLGEICCLPAGMGRAQWTAMAGLDPKPQQSGTSLRSPWHISRQGHSALRAALYMPAIVASRYESQIKAHYEALLERGKPKRVAQCAVMRKMLVAIWGMLRNRQPFDPRKFSRPLA